MGGFCRFCQCHFPGVQRFLGSPNSVSAAHHPWNLWWPRANRDRLGHGRPPGLRRGSSDRVALRRICDPNVTVHRRLVDSMALVSAICRTTAPVRFGANAARLLARDWAEFLSGTHIPCAFVDRVGGQPEAIQFNTSALRQRTKAPSRTRRGILPASASRNMCRMLHPPRSDATAFTSRSSGETVGRSSGPTVRPSAAFVGVKVIAKPSRLTVNSVRARSPKHQSTSRRVRAF